MNSKTDQKPSFILMLGPLGIILFGYQFLFHANLQRELRDRRAKVEKLVQTPGGTEAPGGASTNVLDKIKSVNRQIGASRSELSDARSQLAGLDEERLQLLAVASGQASAQTATLEFAPGGKDPIESTHFAQNSAVAFTHSLNSIPDDVPETNADAASAMMSVCEICDRRKLKRVSNHVAKSSQKSFDESERKELGELLGENLPTPIYFELKLEGGFLDLIAVLHDISRELPMVRIQSLSMDEAAPTDQTRRWVLSLGITKT